MSDRSAIEWTDATWNPVVGCDRISPGCANCYAKTLHDKRHAAKSRGAQLPDQYAQPFESVQVFHGRLDAPLRWRKPRRVFVNSTSDLFHDDVPESFINQVFAVMALAPRHTFQVLTKRPERMRAYLDEIAPSAYVRVIQTMYMPGWLPQDWPLPNVHLGISTENQPMYDARIGYLLRTPAAARFVSCEPLLSALDLRMGGMSRPDYSAHDPLPTIDWCIVGGESGPQARPCNVEWIRSIVHQCRRAGVPVFVKQLGSNVRDRNDRGFLGDESDHWPDVVDQEDRIEYDLDGTRDGYQGAPVRIHLKSRKGGDANEWPEDLRVREFPACRGGR